MYEELSDIAHDILNCLYFVEPFEKIVEECKADRNIIGAELKELIAKRLVTPMRFDESKSEYVRSYIYDSDDLSAFHYLATKDGLLAHNGI